MKRFDVLTIGLQVIDLMIPGMDGHILDREMTLLDHVELTLGGDALNQAIVLSQLGARTALMGAAGVDRLGDVLLQVLFHADIETGRGRMTIDDIADAECKKLIFRHPFLFGGEAESWDELKQKEKGQKTTGEAMAGVARSLPATWRAEKIQKKAAKTGFRWESADEALDKLAEETGELREAVRDHTNIDEELGDVLFAAVRVASTLERDPEQALHAACEKFIRRFTAMEQTALAEGRPLETLSKDELLAGWNAQKRVVPGGEQ